MYVVYEKNRFLVQIICSNPCGRVNSLPSLALHPIDLDQKTENRVQTSTPHDACLFYLNIQLPLFKIIIISF